MAIICLFNLRRLQAKPKVQTDALDELSFVDVMDRMPAQRQKTKGHGSTLTVM